MKKKLLSHALRLTVQASSCVGLHTYTLTIGHWPLAMKGRLMERGKKKTKHLILALELAVAWR